MAGPNDAQTGPGLLAQLIASPEISTCRMDYGFNIDPAHCATAVSQLPSGAGPQTYYINREDGSNTDYPLTVEHGKPTKHFLSA